MAKGLYDGPLTKDMDFTNPVGDGRPASGLAVQNYIKEIDTRGDSKYGAAFVDNDNMCLFFATTEDMETYKADPTRTDLIRGSVELSDEPKYKIITEVTEPENSYGAVFYGSKGNYIKYTFQTIDRDGQRFPEGVDAVYTIQNGGTVTTVRENYHSGASVSFNVDKYLLQGSNEIAITLTGQITRVQKTFPINFQVVDISLIENFDISTIYTSSDDLIVSGTITGSGTRYFEWFVDGNQIPATSADIVTSVGDVAYTRRISLANLTSGRHNLQYRAYVEVGGGERFYSNTMYRDFVVNDQYLTDLTILTKFEFSREYGIIDAFTQPIPLHGPVQYEGFHVGYAIYSKTSHPTESLTITLGSKEETFNVRNGVMYDYEIRGFSEGETPLVFSCLETTLSYNAFIEKSDYNLEPITDTQFEFSGGDRNNYSDNKDTWSFGPYTGTLTGFKWTEASGWNNGRLIVDGGARFDTNYQPYAANIKENGFTFEIEFSTTHVLDETVPIIDLRNNGRGLLITASEIIFSSRGGVTVNTKYKPDENIRVAIVVTSTDDMTYPGFIFIYVDGILTGATTYPFTDYFTSETPLSIVGSNDAVVSVKQIRTYEKALTNDEILDNYILYRDTVEELVDAYDRNNIYEEGSKHISSDKLAAATPIIIITGDVNKLQNFKKEDKGTYVKMDKIEVINMADPTYNMTLINPSMRCQGTSSMEYPRKNFRFYTQADSKDKTVDPYTTQMFDWMGREKTGKNRLYAFKENAQPVKTWCLKADYAESSGTHNTGVARMWNGYMKNARITNIDSRHYIKTLFPNSDTPCKTIAQHLADSNKDYTYDVRTTVDGFPITLFFHEHEGDPLTFLGRYNWNNDKSTESVYGFCDIPGFEPYENTMECWEVVNGDKVCNLFTDLSHWNNGKGMVDGWYDSFEARFPDDHDEPSETERATGTGSALKRVAVWINSTMGASAIEDGHIVVGDPELMEVFSTQKWNYLDVYKIAAYYVYLMRFGAVDQTVKNAMFTTEDGLHWYYINYDNDTINGVENSGRLTLGYDIDRQSPVPGTPGSYCYAGHDSVLWNNLEADAEFMEIVRKVDNALYKAGLTYSGVINMFNENQSAMWSERTHNEDYSYKYLNISDRTQLSKLQGPRKSHRQWWLSHRFAIYDALFGTESYLNNRIAIKPVTSTDSREGQYVEVTPAVDNQIFGYGYQNPVQTGVHGEKDVPIQFPMTESYYEGTTIKFFNAAYFKEFNASKISKYVKELDFTQVNTEAFDSQLTSLILGKYGESAQNTNLEVIENLDRLKYLENIEMCNYQGDLERHRLFSTVNLQGNKYLKTVDFRDCNNLSNVSLPTAAPITAVHLPYSINTLNFNELTDLTTVDIQKNSSQKQFIYDINISNCPHLTNSPTLLLNWLASRDLSITDEECHVTMDNIVWENISLNDLLTIARFAKSAGYGDGENVNFRGYATITSVIPEQDAYEIMDAFGENVFNQDSSFYIVAPPQVYLSGPTELLEGESAQYYGIVIGQEGEGQGIYQIYQGKTANENINSSTGWLTTTEPSTPAATHDIVIRYGYISGGQVTYAYLTTTIKQRVYPTSIDVTGSGELKLNVPSRYDIVYVGSGINGDMFTEWTLTGDIASYASITEQDNDHCIVTLLRTPEDTTSFGTLTAVVKKTAWPSQTIGSKSMIIGYQDDTIAVSRAINPYLMDVLVQNNLIHPELGDTNDKMTKVSASLITADDLNPGTSYIDSIFYKNYNFRTKCKNFDEFQWFTGVTTLKPYTFYQCVIESITFHNNLTTIGDYAFRSCSKLTRELTFMEGLTSIGQYAFDDCTGLTSVIFPSTLTSFGQYAFRGCTGLTHVTFNCNVPTFALYVSNSSSPFYQCTNINSVTIGEGCTSIGNQAFYSRSNLFVGELVLPEGLISIGQNAFYQCTGLTSVTLPSTITAISSYAFNSCTGLTHVTFNCNVPDCAFAPASIQSSLGRWSPFYNCANINSVTVTEGCKYIGQYAFYQCTWLTDEMIDFSNITAIGYAAFYGCTGLTGELILVEGLTTINTSAFRDCTGLTSIILPSTLTTIKSSAFAGCTGLTGELVLPSTVTTFESSAFKGCTGLTHITFNCGVPAYALYVSYSSSPFNDCTNINSVTIGEGCTSIGTSAFRNCTWLTTITLPSTVTSIGNNAFESCTGLTHVIFNCYVPNCALWVSSSSSPFYGCNKINSVTVTEGCASVGSYAFGDCTWLTDEMIDFSNITLIGNSAFQGCTGLTGELILAEGLTTIDQSSFQGCTGLTSVTIPSTVTSFESSAFKGCTSLTSINIPSSVTSIKNYAFEECASLTSIDIPSSVTSIGDYIFRNCANLESITVDSENTTYNDGNGSDCIIQTSNNQLKYGCKGTVIPNGVTSIYMEAFAGTGIVSVTIPTGVTTIQTHAFQNCKELTTVNIPSTTTSIASASGHVFYGCKKLTNITIDSQNNTYTDLRQNCIAIKSNTALMTGTTVVPVGITSIDSYAFAGRGITSINIPSSVETISADSFIGCEELSSITVDSGNTYYNDGNGSNCIIRTSNNRLVVGCKDTVVPNGVTTIGSSAFRNCTGLTSITLPEGVTTIESNAFQGCIGLTSITFPSSLTTIGDQAFAYCTGLTGEIVLAEGLTSIAQYAFRGCTGLTHVTFNCNVPSYALHVSNSSSPFYQCTNINSVTIGEGCKSIGYQAFYQCKDLLVGELVLPSTLTSIGQYAFYYCTGLTSVTFPEGLTTIAKEAFAYCTGLTGEIVFPEGLTTIKNSVFYQCTGLTSVSLPSTLTSIENTAFYNCSNLHIVTSLNTTPPTLNSNALPGTSVIQHIYVPSESVSAYQGATGWNSYAGYIEAIP